jgi:hypothetical protein
MKKIWLSSCLVIAACVEPAPDTNAVAQGLGCDGPASYIDENGDEVLCVYTEDPYNPPPDEPWDWCSSFPEMCQDDPPEPSPPDTGGGGGGDVAFCPTQERQGDGSGMSESNEAEARTNARAEAFKKATDACYQWFYFPQFPSYCERGYHGYSDGFNITDSCVEPYPDTSPNYWRCSAKATVTCSGYTWQPF